MGDNHTDKRDNHAEQLAERSQAWADAMQARRIREAEQAQRANAIDHHNEGDFYG